MLSLLAAALLLAAPAGSDPLLRQLVETRNFTLGRPVAPKITPDEKTVLFLRSAPGSGVLSLFAFDVASGQTRELLTSEQLLHGAEESLSAAEKARRERMRNSSRGITSYALSNDGEKLLLGLSGKLYVYARATGKVTELKTGEGVIDPRLSPDGRQVAYVRDDDVWRVDLATNTEHRVTRGGTPEQPHGVAEFVAQEEMYRFSGYWWSPDSKQLAFTAVDTRGVEHLTISDPIHPERGAEPFPYPRPGKPNAKVRLFVVSIQGGAPRELRWDAEKYPYLATVKWPKQGGPLTLLVQNRPQTEELLLAADPRTGATRTLLVERDEAWLNLDQTLPRVARGRERLPLEHRAQRRLRARAPQAGRHPGALAREARARLPRARRLRPEERHALVPREHEPDRAVPLPAEGGRRAGAARPRRPGAPVGRRVRARAGCSWSRPRA